MSALAVVLVFTVIAHVLTGSTPTHNGARKPEPKGSLAKAELLLNFDGHTEKYQLPCINCKNQNGKSPNQHQVCLCFNPKCACSKSHQHPQNCQCQVCIVGCPHCHGTDNHRKYKTRKPHHSTTRRPRHVTTASGSSAVLLTSLLSTKSTSDHTSQGPGGRKVTSPPGRNSSSTPPTTEVHHHKKTTTPPTTTKPSNKHSGEHKRKHPIAELEKRKCHHHGQCDAKKCVESEAWKRFLIYYINSVLKRKAQPITYLPVPVPFVEPHHQCTDHKYSDYEALFA